jgi:hypothetical protein
VVDAALTKAMTSGEAEKIYAKWFMNPIPPKGLNLGMPLSERNEGGVQGAERQGFRVISSPGQCGAACGRPR